MAVDHHPETERDAWKAAGLVIARARVSSLLPSSMPSEVVRAVLQAVERLCGADRQGVGGSDVARR